MSKIMAGIAVLVLGSVQALLATAAQTSFPIESTAAPELRLPLGARPAATGQAFVAQADDLNATIWNPAGLGQITGSQAAFLHNVYFEEISTEYFAYAQNLSANSGLGAYVSYFNYGTFDQVDDVNGTPRLSGTFSANSYSIGAAYGQWLTPNMAGGVTFKLFNQTIGSQTTSAVALDAGTLFKTGNPGWQFGLALQNLGIGTSGYGLPITIKAGAAWLVTPSSAQDAWRILLDINEPIADSTYLAVNLGTEYTINHMFSGRVGYSIKNQGELGGMAGFSAGLGVKFAPLALDYALVSFGDLGLTHQIMLSVDFDTQPAPVVKEVVKEKEVIVYRTNPEDAKTKSKLLTLEAEKKALEDELKAFKKSIDVGTLNPILFENNRSVLLSSAHETLDKLGNILAQYPRLVVRVEGHTDDVGSSAHNLKLSQRRAEAVCEYLVAHNTNLRVNHLIPIGYGTTRPLGTGKSKAARAKNRRVEFIVINP